MHIFKNWILSFGIKKLAIISTVAVVGVTGTTVAITSVKKSENAVVEEEKIVINSQSDEDKEAEVEKVEEITEEVVNQEVVTETTPEETETEAVKEQTTTSATTTNNSSAGNVSTNTSDNNSNMEKPKEEEPQVDTSTEPEYQSITLYKKTTYNGFEGYFTLSQNIMDVDLVKYGIAESNDSISLYFTEYVDLDTGIYVRFACHGDVMESKFMDFVWKVGPGSVYVKTTK